MIYIKKSKNADARTCDYKSVTKSNLEDSTSRHICDVKRGMHFFANQLENAGINHDFTKLYHIDGFYRDFKNGFKEGHTEWWQMHQQVERHHLKDPKYVQDDVNLIDILEMITDGVMAGLARSGKYRKEEIPDSLLRKAYDNTIQLLLDNVTVED